jgi:hypothetical protein
MRFTITFEEENFSQVFEADDEFDFDSEFSDLYDAILNTFRPWSF